MMTDQMTQANWSTGLPENVTEPMGGTEGVATSVLLYNGLYVVEGALMLVGGLSVVLPVAYHRGLRVKKHYLLIGGLCLADALNGAGYLWAGAYRLYLVLTDTQDEMRTPFWCFWQPASLFWCMAETPTALMLCALSVDRLIAVSLPLWHFTRGARYAYLIIGPIFLLGFVDLLVSFVFTMHVGDDPAFHLTTFCYWSLIKYEWHASLHQRLMMWAVFGSVVILVVMLVVFLRNSFKKSARVGGAREPTAQEKQAALIERKITQTVVVTGLFTLLFYVIPLNLYDYLEPGDVVFGIVMEMPLLMMLWIVSNLNPILNFVTFLITHKELRTGLKAIMACKTLPPDISMWK